MQSDGKLSVLCQLKNGETFSSSYEDFKAKHHKVLLDFYESRIIFPYENAATKKFKELHKIR